MNEGTKAREGLSPRQQIIHEFTLADLGVRRDTCSGHNFSAPVFRTSLAEFWTGIFKDFYAVYSLGSTIQIEIGKTSGAEGIWQIEFFVLQTLVFKSPMHISDTESTILLDMDIIIISRPSGQGRITLSAD